MPTVTDCRSEEGITVGLIDSLISISRVLHVRLQDELPTAVVDALQDLGSDFDFNYIATKAQLAWQAR